MGIDLVDIIDELHTDISILYILLTESRDERRLPMFYRMVNPINWLSYIHGFRGYLLEIRRDERVR